MTNSQVPAIIKVQRNNKTFNLKEIDTMKKITKREKFEMLLNVAEVKGNEMLVEFIEHEIELLARKNGSEKKPTAQQQANAQIQQAILNGMEVGKRYTITDLIKSIPECAELTNQRVSALVRQLMPTYIERVEEKKKAYFVKVA